MLRFIFNNWQTLGTWFGLYVIIAGSLNLFTHYQLDAMQNRGADSPSFHSGH